jgi:ArsR family transcriptional regulator
MEKSLAVKYRAQAQIMKALAHPTRLFIVEELSAGEQCVCEITEKVGVDTSTISKHLSVLKNAGIITDEKKGQNVYYSLKMPCVMKFFSCICDVLEIKAKEHAAMLV